MARRLLLRDHLPEEIERPFSGVITDGVAGGDGADGNLEFFCAGGLGAGDRDINQAHGLLGRAAVGAGNARGADGVIGVHTHTHAFGHFAGGLFRHGGITF